MPKEGELTYLAQIGESGRDHSLQKPFSEPDTGLLLASIGFVMALLPPAPARILDLGCGGGWTSVFFARAGYEVVGQDIAPDMIALGQENAAHHGLTDRLSFVCSDFESLGMDNQFDAAVFFDSLHHAEDELLAIRAAYNALKPGGVLITHEPGEGHSVHPTSIEAMELYGVTERDMPPRLIMERGRQVGFGEMRVVPMPPDLFSIFYTRRYFPKNLWSKRRWKMTKRLFRMMFQPDLGTGAIVIMTK
jgi:SAM-dependent methyltransferase